MGTDLARHVRLGLATVILVGASFVGSAFAITPADQAEALNRVAKQELEAGRAQKAAEFFEQAFALSPMHRYAWNAARVWETLGQHERAHRWYLRAVPLAQDAAERAKDAAAIGTIEAALLGKGFVRVFVSVSPPTADVRLDGGLVEMLEDQRWRWLQPGPHELVIEARGHAPLRETIVVRPARELRLSYTLSPAVVEPVGPKPVPVREPKPEPKPPALGPTLDRPALPLSSPPAWKRTGAFVAGGVGLAALVGGVVLVATGLSKVADANALPLGSPQQIRDYEDAYDGGMSRWWLGLGVTTLGALASGAASWMWLSGGSRVGRPGTSAGGFAGTPWLASWSF
jgi:tetratricopeptide (TPR) repeat protein